MNQRAQQVAETELTYRQLLRRREERARVLSRRLADQVGKEVEVEEATADARPLGSRERVRQQVFRRLLRSIESEGSSVEVDREEVQRRVQRLLAEELSRRGAPEMNADERRRVGDAVVAEVRGFGPLAPLFADPTISDILVNGPQEIWVDRFGRLERTGVRFDDSAHLMRLLGRWVVARGRHLDEASPTVDVRLADGSRLHAVIPPLSRAPVVSIRRMRSRPFSLEEIRDAGTLSPAMSELLAVAVRCGLNIVISGGAASGKTTLLNALSRFIPEGERVVTIEETAELKLEHPHVIALEARMANIEGRGEVQLRNLVKNALRMRVDRIIVGEVRGPEVFDMLQAMNTGHEGSLTTVHANSPADALRRLENLVHLGGFDLPTVAIRELLGAAFDLVVHLTRFLDGRRRVTSLSEIVLSDKGPEVVELFGYKQGRSDEGRGESGRHLTTGKRPTFLERLQQDEEFAGRVFD